MSLARTHGVVISGIEAHVVEIEAHLSQGLPGMSIVGLADTAVGEARDRVRAAVLNSGARWPERRITVGLSPASLHKRGSGLDLSIATAILVADGQLPSNAGADSILFGELGLDGRVRPVRGTVVAAAATLRSGRSRIIVPPEVAVQASVVPGVEAVAVRSLAHWAQFLSGAEPSADPIHETQVPPSGALKPDLSDVIGQSEAVSALEVAAAGGHHVAMVGRPGVGKTLLANRLPTILPDLSDHDALTATSIRSVVADVHSLLRRPPFQAPHHTATIAALVGGGRGGQPYPGSVTLAHAGVLFLDEAAEFGSACLEALRQPLESGEVTIARAGFSVSMPARFQLVMAANPCPCGLGDAAGQACTCRSVERRRYFARLSGPVMDRIDIRLNLAPPGGALWAASQLPDSSATVRTRVDSARSRAAYRAAALGLVVPLTSAYPSAMLRDQLAPAPEAAHLLHSALTAGRISARGADRAIRVAWTLADLSGSSRPGLHEVGHALALRSGALAEAAA